MPGFPEAGVISTNTTRGNHYQGSIPTATIPTRKPTASMTQFSQFTKFSQLPRLFQFESRRGLMIQRQIPMTIKMVTLMTRMTTIMT